MVKYLILAGILNVEAFSNQCTNICTEIDVDYVDSAVVANLDIEQDVCREVTTCDATVIECNEFTYYNHQY